MGAPFLGLENAIPKWGGGLGARGRPQIEGKVKKIL